MEITERQFEIIEAAGRIFTGAGIGGLTIKRLAQEMKFSEAAIYRHFKNKEAILTTMLEYLAQDMDGRFTNIDQNLSEIERFKAVFYSQVEFFKKNKHFVVVVFSDGLLEESDRINQQIYKIMKVKRKYLLPIITAGQKSELFTKAVTTENLMHIVMGSFRLQMYKWLVSNFELDIDQAGSQLIESLLTLIKTK
jgi:TetR/AcrR family fatty acid metabolism transcriptional regulator